ncbi:MAG: hypothetical protein HRU35_01250 [Rickettsiaceae bacterium]|nr:hypothetical protein [Rickettsiaceae bacterium]
MKRVFSSILSILLFLFLTSCGRDLSDATYSQNSTLNIVLKGKVLSQREVTVKEYDKLSDNSVGIVSGAIGGTAIAASSSNNPAMIVGGAVVGGLTGAVVQSVLGTNKGIEYIVQVDTSI